MSVLLAIEAVLNSIFLPLFVFVWCSGVAGGLAGAFIHNRRPRLARRIRGVVIVMVMGAVGLGFVLFATNRLIRSSIWANFRDLSPASIQGAEVQVEGTTIQLDAETARSLKAAIVSGENVWAHHSSPLQTFAVKFEVAEAEVFQYTLARDSDNIDEFWMDDIGSHLGSVPVRRLRQLHAPAVTRILQEAGVRIPTQPSIPGRE